MRRLAQSSIRALAAEVLRRYHPHVIGITGSYGKTSAKEAIAAVLAQAYVVRASAKSFNNEYGVPFTILGVEENAGGVRNVARAIRNGLRLVSSRQPYPTILVLELGADAPGDIARLLAYTPLEVGVITAVGPTHLQRFGSVDAVLAEKSLVAKDLTPHGFAVLNQDDPRVAHLRSVSPGRVVTYGYAGNADVRCLDAAVARDETRGQWGMRARIAIEGGELPVFLPGVAGRQSVYAALAAVAVGVVYRLDHVEINAGLQAYAPPPGRMRIIPGMKQATLLDDSYNASPDAVVAALEALREYPCDGQRYALLGGMADLGMATDTAHAMVGRSVAEEEIDVFVAVGETMGPALTAARSAGLPEDRTLAFDHAGDAARFLQSRLHSGDVVLIKGSQLSRMERAAKQLMAEPERASELLVRQDPTWLAHQ